MTDQTHRADSGELRYYVEWLERLNAEKDEIAEHLKGVMAEAKGRGYDTAILRKILAERKRDSDDLAEERALLDMYREALGDG